MQAAAPIMKRTAENMTVLSQGLQVVENVIEYVKCIPIVSSVVQILIIATKLGELYPGMKRGKEARPRIHARVENLREVVLKRIILIMDLDSASNTSLSRSQHTVSMSDLRWKVRINVAPQDICIEIRIDVDIQRCFVGLKKVNGNLRFDSRSG